MTKDQKKCADCDGRSSPTRQQQLVIVAGRRFVVTLPAQSCRSCGVRVDPASRERMEIEIACELAREGPAVGETFRFMRRALRMRALDVAELLGITPETISRWENEQRSVDRAAWIALGSIVLERARQSTSTLERLRTFAKPAVTAKSIRIVLARSR